MPFWTRADGQVQLKRSFSLRSSFFYSSKLKKSKRSSSHSGLGKTLRRQGSKLLEARFLSPKSKRPSYINDGSAYSAPSALPSLAAVDEMIFYPSKLPQVELPAGFVANEEHSKALQSTGSAREGSPSTNPTSSSSGHARTIASKQAVNGTPASSVTRASSKNHRSSDRDTAPTIVHRPLLAARPIVLPHDGSPYELPYTENQHQHVALPLVFQGVPEIAPRASLSNSHLQVRPYSRSDAGKQKTR
jgi:hypothetical protein